MENRKAPVFALWVSGIIIGTTLYKSVDFKSLTVEEPALAVVYVATLAFIGYAVFTEKRKKEKQ